MTDEPAPTRWGKKKPKNEFAPMWRKYGNDIQIMDAFEYYRPDRNPQWRAPDPKEEEKLQGPMATHEDIKAWCEEWTEYLNKKPKTKKFV